MNKKTKIIIASIVVIALVAGGIGAYFGYFKPHNEAVNAYNAAVSTIQEKNDKLDTEIKKLQELVDNTDKPLDENTIDAAKEALKNAGAAKVVVGEMPNSTDDIVTKTKELSAPVDYSDKIADLTTAYTNLENSKKQYKQVTNPSEEFVMQRILTVDDVVDARAVTEDQDPNGNLHKAGGYTSTIYFESKKVDQSKVYVSGDYSWTDANRKRRYVYAKTLDELRYKEEQIDKDKKDGIKAEARYTTLNDMYELWKDLKRGLKNNTFENYKYMYETFVRHQIGSRTVSSLKKTDIKRFYNYLADERHLKPATIDNIHTVLHQILDMAVDDDYLRNNPSNNVLKELKQSHCFQTEKRRALTRPEQELFLSYLKNTPSASLWYPIFAVLIGTGLRVGEATGLRWCDIDLDEGVINVNHTLVYYDHRTDGSKRGCYFNINTTKTPAGKRQVPMLDFVKEAFLMEKERQELLDIHCEAVIDGYTDFIFLNRFGQPQHQATLNKAIRRIIRDCNDEQLLKNENAEVLLPHFSCHSLRHTFTTRMCEAGVNVKVIQDTLGHKDISTTLNIYTDVTKELRKSEFEGLDSYFKNEYNKANELL